MYIFDKLSLKSSQNEQCFRQTLCRKSKRILCSIIFFSKMVSFMGYCEKIFYSPTDHMTIWGIRTAQWITKATNTHSQYVIFICFPLQQGLHERGLILRYSYIACPVPLTCSPLNVFALEFNSFGIKLHVFVTPLLVYIVFRFFLISTFGLCPQMLVIRQVFR